MRKFFRSSSSLSSVCRTRLLRT